MVDILIRAVFILLMVSASNGSFAQNNRQATDAELKAVYCLTTKNMQVDMLEKSTNTSDQTSNVAQFFRNSLATAKSDQLHLKRYILPRLFDIDPSGPLMAAASAKSDLSENDTAATACLSSCENSGSAPERQRACTSQCFETSVARRIRSCNDLSWLPF